MRRCRLDGGRPRAGRIETELADDAVPPGPPPKIRLGAAARAFGREQPHPPLLFSEETEILAVAAERQGRAIAVDGHAGRPGEEGRGTLFALPPRHDNLCGVAVPDGVEGQRLA